MSKASKSLRKRSKTIGFVPTMGCLHKGHLSLVRKARSQNKAVVVSIFVNPAQFGPKEDYKKYPRDTKRDIRLAKEAGCDILFCPSVKVMYPQKPLTSVYVKELSSIMCGISRPTHFEGVAIVCAKLFNIVMPDNVYMGQKDYQQAVIVKRMKQDLNMGFKLGIMPIIREKNGLAMSSRNEYLTTQQKKDASVLYESLKNAKDMIKRGERNPSKICYSIRRMILQKPGARVDYIVVKDPKTLNDKKKIEENILIAIAAWIGHTRLIDNMVVSLKS
jgi:pantoate--beta-alanine ligase